TPSRGAMMLPTIWDWGISGIKRDNGSRQLLLHFTSIRIGRLRKSTRRLVLLRHIWAGSERVPTEAAGTSLKAASQGCRKPSPHACDRVRHVALRPDRGRRGVDHRREGETSCAGLPL